ncbi:hypothetical protein [Candidatus Ichthyocystis sparus]|uniref:hypothetical protein n=1 Tax=Candidatus Ichthyocystis sparus TaxID=1561004 RepID=UPI000B82627C|nr:hypothetical protein [Candidatus Ichthyocystis sparus]
MDNTTTVTTMGGESPGNEAQEGDHVELAMEHHETPDGGMQNGTGTMRPTGTSGGLSLVRWIRGGNGRRGNQGGNNQGNSIRGEQGGNNQGNSIRGEQSGNNQETVSVGFPPPPYSTDPASLRSTDYELTDPPPPYDSVPILGNESRLMGDGDQFQLLLLPRYGVDGETAIGHPAGRMSLVMGGAARRIEEAQNADAVRRGPEEEEEELVFRCCHSGISASTYCGFFVWALIIIVILAAMFGIGFVYGRDYEKGLNNDSGGGNNSSSPATP